MEPFGPFPDPHHISLPPSDIDSPHSFSFSQMVRRERERNRPPDAESWPLSTLLSGGPFFREVRVVCRESSDHHKEKREKYYGELAGRQTKAQIFKDRFRILQALSG